MEPLAKLVVSALELAESELAALKTGVVRLGLSLVFVIAAGVMGLIGTVLVLAAAFVFLKEQLGTAAALAISGALFLAATAVLGLLAFRKAQHDPAAMTKTESTSHEQPPEIRIAS